MIDAWLNTTLFTFLLILARVGAFATALPLLGGRSSSHLAKASLILSLTVFWFAGLSGDPTGVFQRLPSQTQWLAFALAIGREVLVGAVLGYALGLFVVPFRIAGEFIGQEMGISLGGVADPTQNRVGPAIGQLFELLGVLILFSLDVHHVFFAALHSTFARWPLGELTFPVPVAPFLRAIAETQQWGLLLAAPVGVCLFITSIFLALMARAAPQLNILSVGFALRLAVGLVAVYMLLPDMTGSMIYVLERFSELMVGIV
ncbi:MAG: flagellar biosynthetic protein FliR [Planctomycetota bacterium]|nr:flagellar biosynthetic protein FliR [Planctomycetota bacterium]